MSFENQVEAIGEVAGQAFNEALDGGADPAAALRQLQKPPRERRVIWVCLWRCSSLLWLTQQNSLKRQ